MKEEEPTINQRTSKLAEYAQRLHECLNMDTQRKEQGLPRFMDDEERGHVERSHNEAWTKIWELKNLSEKPNIE